MRLVSADFQIAGKRYLCPTCESPILPGERFWSEVWEEGGELQPRDTLHEQCEGDEPREEYRDGLVEYLANDPG